MSELPINTWEQVGPGGVFVGYRAGSRGVVAGSYVVQVGEKTDPTGPWYNNGHKTFSGKRDESLPLALAWASERFGIKNWRRNAMGDYIDADKQYAKLRRKAPRKRPAVGTAPRGHGPEER